MSSASRFPRVALTLGDRRRGTVAQALALVRDDYRGRLASSTLLKPNLVSHRRQLPSTHADALSATVDALLADGAREIVVAEGATDATAGFARFRFPVETWGRPVRYFDLNRDETEWDSLDLLPLEGPPRPARLSRTVARAEARVSLGLLKTHVVTGVTFGIKNWLSAIHPEDRVMMHGHAPGGNGQTGWRRALVEFLKGDSFVVNAITRTMGRIKNARNVLTGKTARDAEVAFARLSRADRGFLASVAVLQRNLVSLLERTRADLTVLDGFVATHREGPRHGAPLPLGVAVAGTDPVAVDAVAAAVMGFDPMEVGHVALAHEAGLGVADLSRIEIVGDSIEAVRARTRRRPVPHSNHVVHRHWRRALEERLARLAAHGGAEAASRRSIELSAAPVSAAAR